MSYFPTSPFWTLIYVLIFLVVLVVLLRFVFAVILIGGVYTLDHHSMTEQVRIALTSLFPITK